MDCIVHGVSKSRTWLSDFWASLVARLVNTMPAVQEDLLEKEMATHSSIPAWRIPWTQEPGGLESMELQESETM